MSRAQPRRLTIAVTPERLLAWKLDVVRFGLTISYMYDKRSPGPGSDRRSGQRLGLQLFLNQYIKDRPYRALATDVSETGLSIQKLTEAIVPHARIVALEFELPGTRELIWAAAEPRFESVGDDFHASGLRFCAMADKHQRLLRDYVRAQRARLARALPARDRRGILKLTSLPAWL